jgi:hypothetical protein
MAKKCTGCGWLDTDDFGLNKNGNKFLSCCPESSYKEITDIEWVMEKIGKYIDIGPIPHEIIEQLKSMEHEKKQSIYQKGYEDGYLRCQKIIEDATKRNSTFFHEETKVTEMFLNKNSNNNDALQNTKD